MTEMQFAVEGVKKLPVEYEKYTKIERLFIEKVLTNRFQLAEENIVQVVEKIVTFRSHPQYTLLLEKVIHVVETALLTSNDSVAPHEHDPVVRAPKSFVEIASNHFVRVVEVSITRGPLQSCINHINSCIEIVFEPAHFQVSLAKSSNITAIPVGVHFEGPVPLHGVVNLSKQTFRSLRFEIKK